MNDSNKKRRKNITENEILTRGALYFDEKQKQQREIEVHQQVNWPFRCDSEGVETHKKSTGCRKI